MSLSGAPSLALLLSSLIFGSDLEAWPDCCVSAEFLRAPIRGKRSDSTTNTILAGINTASFKASIHNFSAIEEEVSLQL